MNVCMSLNMKINKKEWHPATKPLVNNTQVLQGIRNGKQRKIDSSLIECPLALQEVGGHVCLGFSTVVDDVEKSGQVYP